MSFTREVLSNISLYSYGLAWLAYAALAVVVGVHWRNRVLSLSVIICIVLTSVWGGVIALGSLPDNPPTTLMQSVEAARNAAWMFLLHSMYGARVRGYRHFLAYRQWLPWYSAGIALVVIWMFAVPLLLDRVGASEQLKFDLGLILWLGFSLAVLIMVEQIYRLSTVTERWVVKYLCLGLFVLAGYDFLMYTQALVMRQMDLVSWQARGAVVALTAPLLGVAVLRSRTYSADLPVSRHVVFHTFTMLVAGLYLIYMAGVGYAIHYLGGSWSGVAQIAFLSASGLFFIVLMISSRVRDLLRVWLSKHFFSYRYDYRRVWLDFTNILADSADATPRAVTQAMAKLCGAPAGLLWMRTENGGLVLIDCWNAPDPGPIGDVTSLVRWLEQHLWLVDLREWRVSPERYGELQIPPPPPAVRSRGSIRSRRCLRTPPKPK
jgi:putative PEP-CTERM system histidine kinase